MPAQMKVHPSFFKEFATKTWVSPIEIIKELVENAFDEDSAVEWADSASFLRFDDGSFVEGVDVRSAVTELVPPELVDTYITNLWVVPLRDVEMDTQGTLTNEL